MENGGGKGDVPQDANERKKPTSYTGLDHQ
jgi:hypothetical protein